MDDLPLALPVVALKSAPGVSLPISAKTFGHVARQAEDAAAQLRFNAQQGLGHPAQIISFWKGASGDLEAIRAAHEAEMAAIDTAVAVLDGAQVPSSDHPLIRSAKEMALTRAAFAHAKSQLVRDKAQSMVDDAKLQLRAARDAASRALSDQEHRTEVIRRKASSALASVLTLYSGPLRVCMKDAADLLQLKNLPYAGDTQELPAPSDNPYLPPRDPARLAFLLRSACIRAEAQKELQREHDEAKRRERNVKPRTVTDDVRDALKALEDEA